MARTPSLSLGSLSPFGGSGASFGAFDLVDPGQASYLAFLKVSTAWENGKATDNEYLTALRAYATSLRAGTSEKVNAEQRVIETEYRLARNLLLSQVEDGTKEWADLLEFDEQHLEGLNPDSETYRDRLDLMRSTQARMFAESEETIIESYRDGKMTTAQLSAWYTSQLGSTLVVGNPDLEEQVEDRVAELAERVQDEQDAKVISDFNDGKISPDDFLTFAAAARARYAAGTQQAQEWDDRITMATQQATENDLLYRYNLSQQYLQLQQFVQSNSGKTPGGTSTSTSTRIVLGADGQWKTVTSTSTKATAPTAAEQKAYRDLQIEIADAKAQMAEIQAKIGTAPGGGTFVPTQNVIDYYRTRLAGVTKGSDDWYTIQQKIDGLTDRLHAEKVMAQQGMKITYPKVGASSSASSSGTRASTPSAPSPPAGEVGVDAFMRSLSGVESGGSYTARNASTGAYGKYQILPSNWGSWASKYLGDAGAPMSPENQEKVARGKMLDLYNWLGSWDAVAYWWNSGGSKATATNPANWNTRATGYVNKVRSGLGLAPVSAGAGATTGGAPRVTTDASKAPRGAGGGLTQIIAQPAGGEALEAAVQERRDRPGATAGYVASSFPVNLDAAAFEKFYANYERAFESGAESFVDYSTGRPISYFIGGVASDRITRMRQLDDLRITLFQTKAEAYAGTPSEITAAEQYNKAVRDAAAHEYQIALSPDTTAKGGESNAVVAGTRAIEGLKKAIASETKLAQEAYARGDIDAAYAHLQIVNDLAKTDLSGFAKAAQATLADISQAYGGIEPGEALGEGGGGKIESSIDRLLNYQAELGALLTGAPDKLLGDLQKQIKLDSQGNVVLDQHGSIQLDDGWARFVTEEGAIKIDRLPTENPGLGGEEGTPEGHQQVQVRAGDTVQPAYAKYKVGIVGYVKNPTDPNNPVPIYGKFVTVVVDGKKQVLMEDPLHPGRWSTKRVVFNAPSGLTVAVGKNGETIISFQQVEGGGRGGYKATGPTYSLVLDPKTGVYTVIANQAGSLFTAEVKDQYVGRGGDAAVEDILKKVGLTRDLSGATSADFVNSPIPIFGLTPAEYYRHQGAGRWGDERQGVTNLRQRNPDMPAIDRRAAVDPYAADRRVSLPEVPVKADKWYQDSAIQTRSLPVVRKPALAPAAAYGLEDIEADYIRGATTAVKPTSTMSTQPKPLPTAPTQTTTTTAPKPLPTIKPPTGSGTKLHLTNIAQ